MPGGKGITVPRPLEDPADFEARIPGEVDVKDKLSHVMEAVKRIKQVLINAFSCQPLFFGTCKHAARCCRCSSTQILFDLESQKLTWRECPYTQSSLMWIINPRMFQFRRRVYLIET